MSLRCQHITGISQRVDDPGGGGTPIYWLTACAARVGMLFDQALVSERVSYWGRADVSLLVGVIIGIHASPWEDHMKNSSLWLDMNAIWTQQALPEWVNVSFLVAKWVSFTNTKSPRGSLFQHQVSERVAFSTFLVPRNFFADFLGGTHPSFLT